MLASHQLERLMCLVASMQRDALVEQFRHYRANFPLDFSDEFLRSTSLDRLRHIFVAVCIQSKRLPADALSPAA